MNAGTTFFAYNDRRELTGSDFSVGTAKDFSTTNLMGKRQSKSATAPPIGLQQYHGYEKAAPFFGAAL